MEKPKNKTNKSTVIRTRLTEDQLSQIKDKLKQSGLSSLSEYIRTCALNSKIIVKKGGDHFPLMQELKRSGNNLNQLTKRFNATGIQPAQLRNALDAHERLLRKILTTL